ncbi:MAG: hypothetical protein IPL84_00175 [Chitinophagaceae bacterium]|nr:hypothetical protein [Chitinophagaceae bacterium]
MKDVDRIGGGGFIIKKYKLEICFRQGFVTTSGKGIDVISRVALCIREQIDTNAYILLAPALQVHAPDFLQACEQIR